MTTASSLYGRSLYDLAAEEKLTSEILEEMQTVAELFRENPDYVRLLSEPSVPKKERLGLLDQAFRNELQPYLLNFLKLLVEKGMLRGYQESLHMFRSCYYRDHNITEAVVSCAVPLSTEQKKQLCEKLEKLSGKTVELRERIDKDLLGGLKVEMDGKTLDGSVSGRLSALRKKVNEVVL